MKNLKYSIVSMLTLIMNLTILRAQTQISNAGFEAWQTRTVNGFSFTDPKDWYTLNQLQQFGFAETSSKTSSAQNDSFAVVLKTIKSNFGTIPGILACSPFLMPDGTPDMNLNFKAFSGRPYSISFWFKSFPEDGDQNAMQCLLTKWNATTNTRDTIAEASWTIDSNVIEYSEALIPFTYQSAEMPDSMSIIFSSSINGFSPIAGSEFYVDNIVLSYENNLPELAIDTKIDVYPNPFSNQVEINISSQDWRLEIINSIGQSMFNEELTRSSTNVDLSFLPKGVYHVLLVQSETNKKLSKKIIKID